MFVVAAFFIPRFCGIVCVLCAVVMCWRALYVCALVARITSLWLCCELTFFILFIYCLFYFPVMFFFFIYFFLHFLCQDFLWCCARTLCARARSCSRYFGGVLVL